MPTAVLRRYTPPTCTLEVAAKGSALSRWTNRTVLKNIRFNLSFDDPKLLPEQQITISGDRSQLEALSEVVEAYVHQLLNASTDQVLWEPPLQGQPEASALTGTSAFLPTPAADPSQAGNPSVLDLASPLRPVPSPDPSTAKGILLQPKGLLSHELHLGDLATAESGASVHLTALQLFDLANALEEYGAESMSLPEPEPSTGRSWSKGWLPMAASAVLALGITGTIGKFVLDISRPAVQTASAPAEPEGNSGLSRELFPRLSPPPGLEATPPIALQPLPPPPPGSAIGQANSPGLPPVGVTEAPPPAPASSGAEVPISGEAAQTPGTTALPDPSGTSVAIVPSESLSSDPAAPPRLTGTDAAPEGIARSQVSGIGSDAEDGVAPDGVTPNSIAPDRAIQSSAARSSEAEIVTRSTAFDTIPQVAEVRNYFQQRWQPPAELSQTLEYRLLLNTDGSLQRIVPLGQASANYLDRTSMPLMGEPFISATGNGSTPQIRLVLKPDGSVQSFLEYAN